MSDLSISPHGRIGSYKTIKASNSPAYGDLRQACGFLEGEGYFGRTSLNQEKTDTERITAAQNEREPLEELQKIFGGSIAFSKRKITLTGRTGQWVWAIYGARARGVMYTLFTHMSRRRKDQIKRALAGGNVHSVLP